MSIHLQGVLQPSIARQLTRQGAHADNRQQPRTSTATYSPGCACNRGAPAPALLSLPSYAAAIGTSGKTTRFMVSVRPVRLLASRFDGPSTSTCSRHGLQK